MMIQSVGRGRMEITFPSWHPLNPIFKAPIIWILNTPCVRSTRAHDSP
jgi:hypothetical protein